MNDMIVLSVVGARPEFVQAAPVSAALRGKCREVFVHTGQHYDDEMSQTFFRDLDLPKPDLFLSVGSGTQGQQTARLIERIEQAVLEVKPDLMLLRSDTNSTLGAALVAAKLQLPIVKLEAGCRSFDRSMPEEINRVVTDHLSDLLLCSTPNTAVNLQREGIDRPIEVVGDVLVDSIDVNLSRAQTRSGVLHRNALKPQQYVLATIHRAGNTDDPVRLRAILDGLRASPLPVIFPVHPRTLNRLKELGIELGHPLLQIEPVSYLDMLALISSAVIVATDSGGIQREAYVLGRPCVTLRPNTEWIETVEAGWNRLVDANSVQIVDAIRSFRPTRPRQPLFGDGHAAARAAEQILLWAAQRGLTAQPVSA